MEELVLKYRLILGAVIAIITGVAATIHAKAVAPEYEQAGFFSRTFGSVTNPASVVVVYVLIGLVAIWLSKFLAIVMAERERDRRVANEKQTAVLRQRQEEQAEATRLKQLESEHAKSDARERVAYSKDQVVKLLGNVDQFVRAWEAEPDPSRRAGALQGAQAAMTTLQAKLVAGDIVPEAVMDSFVVDMARETQRDLHRCGLEADRLSRDLVRVFKLTQSGGGGSVRADYG